MIEACSIFLSERFPNSNLDSWILVPITEVARRHHQRYHPDISCVTRGFYEEIRTTSIKGFILVLPQNESQRHRNRRSSSTTGSFLKHAPGGGDVTLVWCNADFISVTLPEGTMSLMVFTRVTGTISVFFNCSSAEATSSSASCTQPAKSTIVKARELDSSLAESDAPSFCQFPEEHYVVHLRIAKEKYNSIIKKISFFTKWTTLACFRISSFDYFE